MTTWHSVRMKQHSLILEDSVNTGVNRKYHSSPLSSTQPQNNRNAVCLNATPPTPTGVHLSVRRRPLQKHTHTHAASERSAHTCLRLWTNQSRASSLPLGGVLEAPRGDERAGDTAFSGQNELPVRGASGGLVRRVAGCQAPGHMMDRPGRGSRQEVKREVRSRVKSGGKMSKDGGERGGERDREGMGKRERKERRG